MSQQYDYTVDDQELEALNWGGFRRKTVYIKFHKNLTFGIYDVSICQIMQGKNRQT